MVGTVEERVVQYLETYKREMLGDWMSKVMIDERDPFGSIVSANGLSMMKLVIAQLTGTGIKEDELCLLAQKVSVERLEANANIGEFVYNVNIGRSEILEHLPMMNLSIEEFNPIISKINYCFDKFLFYAVQHYTDLKNRQLEEKSSFIEQTHKDHLTILGQMSSSFVHEFRNPLTSVIGFVQLLRERYPSLEYLDVLTKELSQLKYRINQFLLVSKKGVDLKERERFGLVQMFEDTLEFLYPMLVSSDILVEREIDESIFFYGYCDEFRQVLINILMNSFEALSENRSKVVKIQAYVHDGVGIVSISNNGPAISSGVISTIFEPFVSTKQLGTGIGLYVCRKIITAHQGTIECDSNDAWTTFRLRIPIH